MNRIVFVAALAALIAGVSTLGAQTAGAGNSAQSGVDLEGLRDGALQSASTLFKGGDAAGAVRALNSFVDHGPKADPADLQIASALRIVALGLHNDGMTSASTLAAKAAIGVIHGTNAAFRNDQRAQLLTIEGNVDEIVFGNAAAAQTAYAAAVADDPKNVDAARGLSRAATANATTAAKLKDAETLRNRKFPQPGH